MAYRSGLVTRARLFAQHRFTPSVSYLNHHDDRKSQHVNEKTKSFLQTRSYGFFHNYTNTLGINGLASSNASFQDPRWCHQFAGAPMTTSGFTSARNISTEASAVVSEVAAAAADSWLPVAAIQFAIDGVHNFTGFNWWSSIVITTLITSTLQASINIYLLFIKKSKDVTPPDDLTPDLAMKKIYDSFVAITLMTINTTISFSFLYAILNMVEKVPSFKTGGPCWFLDLTTADYFVLPCLTLYSYWLKERAGLDYSNGDLEANLTGYFALLILVFPFLPKAFYFGCITSYLFHYVFRLYLRRPILQKLLNISYPHKPEL